MNQAVCAKIVTPPKMRETIGMIEPEETEHYVDFTYILYHFV